MAETEIISSSENNDQFFEGVEKLIEIWFTPAKNADLRKISRQQWENVLKIVRCEIISFTQSEQVDAYVLSESSMFVSRRRWILKTCGTTTPLRCVRAVLGLARDVAGHARVDNVFYSRREFARPAAQLQPHDNFDSEVKLLDSFFGDGRAYIMGPEKDCWYLYTLLPLEGTVDALEKEQSDANEGVGLSEPDQTIEILMSDLEPAVMDIFTRQYSADAAAATRESGIDKIIPGMVIDDFLFDPCGYSMNGVAKDGCYMTIHITPERSCSYVSFESNVPVSSYDEVIARVLQAFRPAKFVLTVFATPVKLLDSFFGDGRAYIMGPEKDCWYLYTLLPLEGTVDALEKEQSDANEGVGLSEPDQTIEILMSDLEPAVMDIFTRQYSADAAAATRESGIDKIIPGMVIDDFLFDPCGYSMNGVAKDGCYMTIHITPERSCSYVSFESNVPVSSYDEVIARVLQAFRPAKFVLTVFATPDSPGASAARQLKKFPALGAYSPLESQHCRFSGYELQYALYAKFPS